MLSDPTGQEGDDVYKVLIPKIDNHFIPKKNKDYVRFQLSELKQQSHERSAGYYARVRDIAKKSKLQHARGRPDLGSFDTNHAQQQVTQQSDTRELDIGQDPHEAALNEQTTEQAEAMSKELDDE